jgi:hypothetical protein
MRVKMKTLWKKSLLDLMEIYEQKNIFNADKMGLFIHYTNKTFSMTGDSCHGRNREQRKDCFVAVIMAEST